MEDANDTGQNYKLLKDDILIGTLQSCSTDWPWIICDFDPTPEFEKFADLFAHDANLLSVEGDPAQEEMDIVRLIQDQNFILKPDNDSMVVTKFILHIRSNKASFRPRKSGTIYKDQPAGM